jgi:glycosyltransferase involved in cell wall biosynthesis
LLADCAVGAFPSYVEGFGLGVIEQLAAGIPTVAFDVPGPRDILRVNLRELLVPSGDLERFADAVCNILELDPSSYEMLSRQSVAAAAAFDWARIAQNTLDAYRQRLSDRVEKILFVQPFSLGSGGGGGARILRALLEHAPMPWHSVCCSPRKPRFWPNETHLPSRPSWGKIETSRLAKFPKMTMSIFAQSFRRRLKSFCQHINARAVHTVPHSGLEFLHAQAVARELSLPFFISLHDDLAYTTGRELRPSVREPAMRDAWLGADARFVISEALGQEYSRRYGRREYQVVTDGLKELPSASRNSPTQTVQIYFMGLFHLTYEPNLRSLLEALVIFEREHPGTSFKVTCRCEYIRPHVWKDVKHVEVLPFADEAQIARDLKDADLLYMPMPFGQQHENFTRFSVSTKMVTYVGSGIPIIYHGPSTSAAYELLQRNRAAIFLTTLDVPEISRSLAQITDSVREQVVANALELAGREFMIADQTRKFWNTICGCMRAP